MFDVNKNPTPKELRQFGVVMVIGFTVIGVLVWLSSWFANWDASALSWTGTTRQYTAIGLGVFGIVVCLIGQTASEFARIIYVVWMTVGGKIGLVMSTLMLSLLFFVFLPVFSIIVRWGDPLRKKLSDGDTYWEDYRPHEPTLERMQRLF